MLVQYHTEANFRFGSNIRAFQSRNCVDKLFIIVRNMKRETEVRRS